MTEVGNGPCLDKTEDPIKRKIRTILYIGDDEPRSNSFLRSKALERLGYEVSRIQVDAAIPILRKRFWRRLFHRVGYKLTQYAISGFLSANLRSLEHCDLVWVDNGELLGPMPVQKLKASGVPVLLYTNEDPTGTRDGRGLSLVRSSLKLYDLCAIRVERAVDEFLNFGCRRIFRMWMTYDECEHKPVGAATNDENHVLFVGTNIRPDRRLEFIEGLARSGLDILVAGNGWPNEINSDTNVHFSPPLFGADYCRAVGKAKVSLGLVSTANRDGHTRRSVEIPFAGGILCALKTPEHGRLFREGVDALFWSSIEECSAQCRRLMNDDSLRNSIGLSGRERVRRLGLGNERVCSQLISVLSETDRSGVTTMTLQG